MYARAEGNRAIAGGALCLAGIAGFVGLAILSLLAASPKTQAGGAYFDAYIWRVVRFTLLQAVLSTVLSVVLAIPVARALVRQPRFPGRIWILRLMALPLGLPAIVAALGIITVWGRQGTVNDVLIWAGLDQPLSIYGLQGILLAHVFFNLPLAVRLFVAGLERIPGEYWRLSANLGMRPFDLYRFIEWPVIRKLLPGVAGLIFMLCATSFTLVLTLGGGPAATTIEVAIYQALRFDFDPPRAVILSALQIALTALLLSLSAMLPDATEEGQTGGSAAMRFDGGRWGARTVDLFVIGLAVLLVGLPLLSVALSGVAADFLRLLAEPTVQRAFLTSCIIAFLSALLSLASTGLIIRAERAAIARQRPGVMLETLVKGFQASTSFILLVPPVILGAGWFLLLRPFGHVGAFAPLIILVINALMAMPFVYRILKPAYLQHETRTGRLSLSLGITGLRRLWLNDLPALRRPALMALSFAAALSLGDLGAVALFGSQDVVTLPWLLYSRMGSYRTADAAGLALILGLLCLVLTIFGTRENSAREGGPL